MTKVIINDAMEDQKILIHRDHNTWLNALQFYGDEAKFFKKELTNVTNANNDSLSVIEHVQEYQKILDKKLIALEALQEDIKFQQKIFSMDEILPDNIEYHLIMKEKYEKFVKSFEELKPAFKRFSSHFD